MTAPATHLALAIIAMLTNACVLFAQPPDTAWVRDYGTGTSGERVECIRPVPGGGYIISGDTDVGMYSAAKTIRIDDDGNVFWSLVEQPHELDGTEYIDNISDGGFIQGGGARFNPPAYEEGYVRKLTADGDQEWVRLFGTNNIDDWVSCVREVPAGGYIAVGVDNAQWFLWRMGPQGQYMWERHLPYEFYTRATFVEPLADGGFVIAGNYPDGFSLYKTDSQGIIVWENQYFSLGRANCVRELPNGNLIASGRQWYNILTNAWEVIMTDPDGNVIWNHEIDDEDDDTSYEANECWIMADGNLVVCGMGQDEDHYYHRWIIKYDLEGNVLWHKIIPDGELFTICQGRDGGILVGGIDYSHGWPTADLFRIFKLEPEVEVDLQPDLTIIPETGGWLTYDTEINNILVNTTTMDTWTFIVDQNGNGTVVNPSQITLEPGIPYSVEDISIEIPADIPNGEYVCEYHIGNLATDQNMGLGAFTFWKGEVAVDDSDNPHNDNPLPNIFALSAHPNPFNALTTITLSLPQPGDVRLSVYNTLGQEVARLHDLANGSLSVGVHQFQLDGSSLSSGTYIVHARFADQTLQQKIVVVK